MEEMHRARNGEGSQLSYCVHHSPRVSINLEALHTPIFCILMEASLHWHELVIDSTSSPFPSLKERKGSKFAESHHHLTCCYVIFDLLYVTYQLGSLSSLTV